MIKNYQLFKESILNKLKGPTEEEVFNNIISKYINDYDSMLKKFVDINLKRGIDYVLDSNYVLNNETKYSIFYNIIKSDNLVLMKYLIRRGIILNKKEVDDFFEAALNTNKPEISKYLRDNFNAELNDKKVIQNTIKYLVSVGNVELIKLIDKEIELVDDEELTYFIFRSEYNIELFKYLFKKLKNPNVSNSFILRKYVERENYDMTKFLLENGSDVNVFNGQLLNNLAVKLSIKMVKLLMEYNIKIENYDKLISNLNQRLEHYIYNNKIKEIEKTKIILSLLSEYNKKV